MNNNFEVTFSNKVEDLFLQFTGKVFSPPSTPFTKRFVIAPSPAMKTWLMLQMADHPILTVSAGLEIDYLDGTLGKLLRMVAPARNRTIPEEMELAFAIESKLRENLGHEAVLPSWEPVRKYLGDIASRKGEKRLISLSEKLASLFIKYGKFGSRMLQEWESLPQSGWQQMLWCQLFVQSCWSYPYRELNMDPIFEQPPDASVHIFALSFIPGLFHRFLMKLSKSIPVHYYMLSPCMVFWEDIQSERECLSLYNYWKSQRASTSQLDDLEKFLRDRNPLLANYGQLGKEMAKLIEDSNAITHEFFSISSEIENFSRYEWLDPKVNLIKETHSLKLLECVHADLLMLCHPKDGPIDLKCYDGTIQVHGSYTHLREVQALQDIILGIIAKHAGSKDPIAPEDIVVMAPDIMEYEPFIKMVFQGSLEVHIMDLAMPAQNAFTQGFLHLIDLPFGRWDAAALLELFQMPDFQSKHHLTEADEQTIRYWIKEGGIHWAFDMAQRDELLKRDHCSYGMSDAGPAGTWDWGIRRLLAGLTSSLCEENRGIEMPPFNGIEVTEGELLGKLITILYSLKEDLQPLVDGTQMTLPEWSSYLRCLCEAYFTEESEGGGFRGLFEHMDALRLAGRNLMEARYPFSSIRRQLEASLTRQKTAYKEAYLHAVRFCSLLPMRAIPAKVVILLGMNEGAFPRQDHTFSLNLMAGNPSADYCPTQTDFDRYLFLEALLSARRYFILSYLRYSHEDFKEQPPSLVISELLEYLDQGFRVDQGKLSELCVHQHPYLSFDKSYFESKTLFKSYDKNRYKLAAIHYSSVKEPPHIFINNFSIASRSEIEFKLNFKDLKNLARDPLETYFKKVLKCTIRDPKERRIQIEEKFQLSNREKAVLRSSALKNQPLPIEPSPKGFLYEYEKNRLHKEINEHKSNLVELKVDPQQIFQIEFSDHCLKPMQDAQGKWVVPPLQFLHGVKTKVSLVGKLQLISSEGLIIPKEKDRGEMVKAWPEFLALQYAVEMYNLPITPNLLFTKDKKKCAPFDGSVLPHWEAYFDYYLQSLANPLPLLPEWIENLIKNEPREFKNYVVEYINGPFKTIYNQYVLWILRESELCRDETLIAQGKRIAEGLFKNAFGKWYRK